MLKKTLQKNAFYIVAFTAHVIKYNLFSCVHTFSQTHATYCNQFITQMFMNNSMKRQCSERNDQRPVSPKET